MEDKDFQFQSYLIETAQAIAMSDKSADQKNREIDYLKGMTSNQEIIQFLDELPETVRVYSK